MPVMENTSNCIDKKIDNSIVKLAFNAFLNTESSLYELWPVICILACLTVCRRKCDPVVTALALRSGDPGFKDPF